MKKCFSRGLGVVVLALVAGVGCNKEEPQQPNDLRMGGPAQAQTAGIAGDVLETMDSGGYTYIKVKTADKEIWAAGPQTTLKVGDKVAMDAGLPMQNYKSTSLDRTFDVVYFVQAIGVNGKMAPGAAGGMGQMPSGHPGGEGATAGADGAEGHTGAPAAAATEVDLANIKKADGGKTVAEAIAEKGTLSGKQVKIRAKVVKFNANIMGKNWLHIRDGSGDKGMADLTVTTSAPAKVGDLILAEGTVVTNKDFGAGYKYDVILEDAKVTVE